LVLYSSSFKGRKMKRKVISIIAAAVCCLWPAVPGAAGKTFTLSDDDLMSLDTYQSPNLSKIVDKRDVSGPGVEFDIYFHKYGEKYGSIEYVSRKREGEEVLVDINVQDYNAFALQFTLVAVDGNNEPNTGGRLVVGALVNAGYTYAYRPEAISFVQGQSNTAVSITETDADKIWIVGFTAYITEPDGWDPNGTTVTVLIKPAPDAEVPP
jgi:hypothetical protein